MGNILDIDAVIQNFTFYQRFIYMMIRNIFQF